MKYDSIKNTCKPKVYCLSNTNKEFGEESVDISAIRYMAPEKWHQIINKLTHNM